MSDEQQRNDDQGRDSSRQKLGVWQVIKSTAAAAFGVQSEDARQRDFSKGSPAPFIIAGLIFTVLFIIALVVVVNLVLSSAGA